MCSHGQIFHRSHAFIWKSFRNFYSAKSWLYGRRYNFVGTKLAPLIEEKCKSTDNLSSDKKEYGKL